MASDNKLLIAQSANRRGATGNTADFLVLKIPIEPSISELAFFRAGVQSALDSTWLRDLRTSKAEALMNVHVSYRLPKNPAVEKDVQHQIEKLQ